MPYQPYATAIPANMMESLRAYIDHRRPCGHFLTAVLSNDLREACARADHVNEHLLKDYVAYLHNRAPMACWGSPEAVEAWLRPRTADSDLEEDR